MTMKEDHLQKALKDRADYFKDQSEKHKRHYRRLRYISFGLTGSSAILAGAALTFPTQQVWLNLAVVFVSAIAGIATSVEGLRKPSELWIHERGVYYALKDLEREMEYEASESGDLKNPDDYFKRLQQILTTSTTDWSKKVSEIKS